MGVPYKKVFNEAIQAVRVFFHDPVGNSIELNQENNTVNLFSLAQNKLEETKVKLESEIDSQPSQPESQSESQQTTPDSLLQSQPISQTEPNQPGKEPTENKPTEILPMAEPEIQMNPIATVIAEENLEIGIDLQVPDTADENIVQSAVTENMQSVESHSNETQPNLVDQETFEVAATPIVTAQAAAKLQAEQIKPEPLINEVSYKCESKDQESYAPKSMSNMQKIIFGSLLLAIYMI